MGVCDSTYADRDLSHDTTFHQHVSVDPADQLPKFSTLSQIQVHMYSSLEEIHFSLRLAIVPQLLFESKNYLISVYHPSGYILRILTP